MRLDVYLHGRRVGELSNDDGSLSFAYLDDYAADPSSFPLSVHLPLRAEPFGQRDSLAFFSNLLPEGFQRDAVARGVGISAGNDFALLRRFGDDCAGAVTIRDPSERPAIAEADDLIPLAERLDELLGGSDTLPPLVAVSEARLSLAGAQPKLPVVVRDGAYFLPRNSRHPTTHILKPPNARFEQLVANELFCMQLATMCGFSTAATRMSRTRGRISFLEVKRYDRDALTGKRLHQEDFCQALGRLPTEKYQADGGPSLVECFALIDEHSAIPATDKQRLWATVTFNFLIGNCDAHAKNFSFLYESRAPRMAPLYDLVSTVMYERLTRTMAMSIGHARTIDEVNRDAFEELAEACGLNVGEAMHRVDEAAESVATAAHRILDQGLPGLSLPDDDDRSAMPRQIVPDIHRRATQLGVSSRGGNRPVKRASSGRYQTSDN